MESNQAEWEREKKIQNENRLRELSDTIKHNSIHIIGIQQEKRERMGTENSFEEVIAENYPILGKETEIQTQEAWRAPNNIQQGGPYQNT